MAGKKPGTNLAKLKEVPTGPQYKTLTGAPSTLEACPYLRDGEPHVFVVLAYAPGAVLQSLCQHCLLLVSLQIAPDPTSVEKQN